MSETKNNGKKAKILTLPNILSFFRIALVPLIVWLYCGKQNHIWAGIVLLFSGFTDVVDGYIARHYNSVSDFGKILDPFADKLTQAAMLICLVFRFPLMLAPFIFLILKELFMTVSGYVVIKKTGIVLGAVWHGKAATVLLHATMILHIFWASIPAIVSNILILISSVMIFLSLVLYATRNIKAIRGGNCSEVEK